MPEYEVSMMISNSRDTTITLVLEPLGVFYPVEPHATFTLVLQGPLQGPIEVVDDLESITVNAWASCIVLSRDGKEFYRY